MKFRLVMLAAMAFALSACGFNLNVTRGSGSVITETRPVSNFHAVELGGIGELNITQGETESLTIEADDNLMPLLTTQVKDGTLEIGFDSKRGSLAINPSRPIKYNLQVKNLDSVVHSGAGNITAPALKSEALAVGSSGAGNINLAQLDVRMLDVSSSGVGNVLLAGQADTQTASLTGLGNFNAADLKSARATTRLTGAGNATVWATDTLDATISGVGSVSYYGTPQVTQQISGIGSIKSLGAK